MDARSLDVSEVLSVSGTLALPPQASAVATGGVLVSHLNPPELLLYLYRTGGKALRGKRHIGYWAYELPVAPESWKAGFKYVDEVWCPSEFTAGALRALAPPGFPVRVVPHPVFVTPRLNANRARFNLPDAACVVLIAFDLRSTAARKNPFGALTAYELAFPAADGRSLLLCKVVGANAAPEIYNDLCRRAALRPDIRLLEEDLAEDDMLRLVASADVVLSLHRAEGFGLLLAEAMWLGRAVIATGWSGNMDFMDSESAVLVDWRLTSVDDPQGVYEGASWAEPDVAQAARHLTALAHDPAARLALGERGRRRAKVAFDQDAWLRAVRPRLSGDIGEAP
jgi:glycosyltransferase involved in cell wall biosynthesis